MPSCSRSVTSGDATRPLRHSGSFTAAAAWSSPYLIDLLRQHRSDAARDDELAKLVFRSPTGRMLDRHNVRRRGHDSALRRAGLSPEVRLHDLRHTAATLWLAAGESIYFVRQQLGHKDIQTTIDLYGHLDQAAHCEAAARAAQWWREDASA